MVSIVELWNNLIEWMETFEGATASNVKLVETEAGRGLVARSDIPHSTVLINIPFEALLNVSTLRILYPQHFITSLTSTQWISLHLSLQHRRHLINPLIELEAIDKFWPFIVSLPNEFGTVPLSWSIGAKSDSEIMHEFEVAEEDISLVEQSFKDLTNQKLLWKTVLDSLPLSVKIQAEDVEKRFLSDWRIVKKVWNSETEISEATGTSLGFYDFLWAWLNVNSRCVYFDLGGKTSDNLTLAPVIDMINHRFGMMTQPLQTRNSLSFCSPSLDSSDGLLKTDDELGFTYGAHENSMLLAEYGFILPNNPFDNININLEIFKRFKALGDEGEVKKGILEDQGYWGDYTLQPTPEPASASWRVLVALRLLLLPLENSTDLNSSIADNLEPWYDLLSGEIDLISDLNENGVKEIIKEICIQLQLDSVKGIDRCIMIGKEWETLAGEEEIKICLSMIKSIWLNEKVILDAVINNL